MTKVVEKVNEMKSWLVNFNKWYKPLARLIKKKKWQKIQTVNSGMKMGCAADAVDIIRVINKYMNNFMQINSTIRRMGKFLRRYN